MKRKISLTICALTLALGLTGCSNKESIQYNKDALSASCEQVFTVVSTSGITGENVSEMSEWNQGYLMAQLESQTGVKMEAEDFITALDGWVAAQEECGAYIGHGEYTFEESATGITVSAEGEFEERTADLEFTFNKELELEAFNVSAHFSTPEILQKAGLNTLLGMGTVFLVLIFMSFIISLFKYVPALFDKSSKKPSEEPKSAPKAAEPVVEEEVVDDTELIAVIAAAIAAAEGTSTDGFVVRSIKRRKSNKWNA